ncbi:hypothetical protein DOW39_18555 [Salmonella enterica subsp. enterica serovar Tanger]|nr:hypothetical protein [Salmonella enterica subsp. enterica serovar Tanger]EBV4603601.1 hypothetical protein [Salmonella enterica subsp. enterica serovar Tanger]
MFDKISKQNNDTDQGLISNQAVNIKQSMNSKIKIAIAELKEIIFQKRHLCIQQFIHDENNKKGVINSAPLWI